MADNLGVQYGRMVKEAIERNTTNQIGESVRLAPFNKFKRGIITDKIAGTSDYEVLVDNRKYRPIQALASALPLSISDLVFCIVPDNQMSNMFIIGAVSTTIHPTN